MTRFIKRLSATKDGEKADDIYQLDICKIEEEEKYDGFYALATNVDARPIYHQQQKKTKKSHTLTKFYANMAISLMENIILI